jgi:hypothetical protein
MTDMQPESSQPLGGPEKLPMPPVNNGERVPVLPTPETGIEQGAERFEQTAEAQAAAADAAATGAPVITPVVPSSPIVQDASIGSPAVAADEDVIEKEWVDKAKKIIDETKDDPHSRTQKVNQLQKDYLRKRYGKELGAAQ